MRNRYRTCYNDELLCGKKVRSNVHYGSSRLNDIDAVNRFLNFYTKVQSEFHRNILTSTEISPTTIMYADLYEKGLIIIFDTREMSENDKSRTNLSRN